MDSSTSRTRIKLCGITRKTDFDCAAQSGADAIGLVFQPQSPRCLSLRQARDLLRQRPPFVSIIALFMNAQSDEVRQIIDSVHIDCLQFHGDESEDFCTSFGLPYIKAAAMGTLENPAAYADRYRDSASALVLDSNAIGEIGGTGRAFDWSKVRRYDRLPIIMAGGLNPYNVQECIHRLHPFGVDVASGVEREAGIKDHKLLQAFVAAVRQADNAAGNDMSNDMGDEMAQSNTAKYGSSARLR